MYAIYDRNKLVYAFVLSLSLVNPILTMVSRFLRIVDLNSLSLLFYSTRSW